MRPQEMETRRVSEGYTDPRFPLAYASGFLQIATAQLIHPAKFPVNSPFPTDAHPRHAP